MHHVEYVPEDRLARSATDKEAVDARELNHLVRIRFRYRATIQDPRFLGDLLAAVGLQPIPYQHDGLVHLVETRDLACVERPYRLIRDYHLLPLGLVELLFHCLQLREQHFFALLRLLLLQVLADAVNDPYVVVPGLLHLRRHYFLRLVEVPSPLIVADEGPLDLVVSELLGGHFTRVAV